MRRTVEEIDEQMDRAADLEDSGENPYWGMTYAQGVKAALGWVTGELDEEPLPENLD